MPRENHGTETITIAGHEFKAPLRYSEGHELTAGEASQLNQVLHENLRNNFAKRVKDAVEANSFDPAEFQASFDAYADSYEMGIRAPGGGGGSRDPVKSEALSIAKGIIRTALKKKGKKAEPAAITAAAHKLLDAGDDRATEIFATAKKRVEEAQLAAGEDLSDLLDEIPEKAAAAPQAAAAE